MADADLTATLKAIQSQLDNQAIAVHQTLQQYMSSVDSRLAELKSQFVESGSPAMFTVEHPSSSVPHALTNRMDSGPLLRTMKLEVPKFDGSDPHGWIFRINEFFDFHGTPDDVRLRIVSFHLDGKASAWYQWMKANKLLTNWTAFLHNLKLRFGASIYEDHEGALSKLTQTSTVAEFQTEFEDLMNKVTGISEPLLISFFITGLRPDIRREFFVARPSSLMEAFALARVYEARGDDAKMVSRSPSKWTPSHSTTQVPSILPNSIGYSTTHTNSPLPSNGPVSNNTFSTPSHLPPLLPSPSLPIRRLSPQELREKRDKGLCYNCDQKWNASHKCRSKSLLLLGTNDKEGGVVQLSHADPSESVDESIVTGDISSLNALAGQGNPRSLRLIGEINKQSVQVLIDSGSTHNFIKPGVAEMLGLNVQTTSSFRVYIGNGDSLVCQLFCPKVALLLQSHVFVIDLYVLPIEGPDIILGIQWLQLLGKVSHDYVALTMEFMWNGASILLSGDTSLCPRKISFNQFQALLSHDTVLDLPSDSKLHPDSHVYLIKPFNGQASPPTMALPKESYNNQPIFLPVAICATRQVLVHGVPQQHVLVQWQDCDPENATWEPWLEFSKLYPDFHLEDKVLSEGVGNDTAYASQDNGLDSVVAQMLSTQDNKPKG